MKKTLCVVLVMCMLIAMIGCTNNENTEPVESAKPAEPVESAAPAEPAESAEPAEPVESAEPVAFEGKIGIMCGTIATSEEQYRTAEAWKEKLGEDRVVIQTYPDNFMKEQETTISNLLSLVSDPEIKVVAIVDGIPGTTAAIEKAKEKRPDVLYIVGSPNEDPSIVAPAADVIIDMDWISHADQMIDRAKELGADTVVVYSFPRLMGYARCIYQDAAARARCEELGMEYVYVAVPDPQSDAGQAGLQQACREDIPKQLEKYGPNTAFWDYNTYSSSAVIKTLVEAGEGIYINSSQSSPFQGYPEAFNIDVPSDKRGDAEWMVEQLHNYCVENGCSGRFSVRSLPTNCCCLNIAVQYGVRYLQGDVNGKFDADMLKQCFSEVTDTPVDELSLNMFVNPDNGESYDNYCMILAPWALL